MCYSLARRHHAFINHFQCFHQAHGKCSYVEILINMQAVILVAKDVPKCRHQKAVYIKNYSSKYKRRSSPHLYWSIYGEEFI